MCERQAQRVLAHCGVCERVHQVKRVSWKDVIHFPFVCWMCSSKLDIEHSPHMQSANRQKLTGWQSHSIHIHRTEYGRCVCECMLLAHRTIRINKGIRRIRSDPTHKQCYRQDPSALYWCWYIYYLRGIVCCFQAHFSHFSRNTKSPNRIASN